MKLNLLVLRCKSIQITKTFYEKLGLIFVQEQHGKGAVHYATYVDEMVLELYPLKEGFEIEQSRLGFSVAKGFMENMQENLMVKKFLWCKTLMVGRLSWWRDIDRIF